MEMYTMDDAVNNKHLTDEQFQWILDFEETLEAKEAELFMKASEEADNILRKEIETGQITFNDADEFQAFKDGLVGDICVQDIIYGALNEDEFKEDMHNNLLMHLHLCRQCAQRQLDIMICTK